MLAQNRQCARLLAELTRCCHASSQQFMTGGTPGTVGNGKNIMIAFGGDPKVKDYFELLKALTSGSDPQAAVQKLCEAG